MKWKDTQDSDILDDKSGEAYFNEERYTAFEEEKRAVGESNISSNKKSPSFLKIFIGLFVAVVVLILFFIPGLFSTSADKKVLTLEKKVKKLEQRFNELSAVDEKVTRIWEQAKSFEKFKDRFNRSEASMSLRMDHLAMSLDAIQKKMAKTETTKGKETKKTASRKPAPKVPEKKSSSQPAAKDPSGRYHVVAKGETLYRIGLKYNIKPDALIELNNLPANPVIKPGQKLLIPN